MVICMSLLLVFNSVWTPLSAHSIKFGTNSYTSLWMCPTSNKIDKMIRLKSDSHFVIVSSLFCQSHCTQLHWWQLLKIMSKFCFQNSLQNDFLNPHSLVEFHLWTWRLGDQHCWYPSLCWLLSKMILSCQEQFHAWHMLFCWF